jgi:hypothetical protein
MTTTMEEQNATLRAAVAERLARCQPDDHRMQGCVTEPLPVRDTAEDSQQNQHVTLGYDAETIRKAKEHMDALAEHYAEWTPPAYARQTGDGVLGPAVHPTSQAFFDLCDALKDMHRRKSSDYGCPSGTDPLANIRNGARFVGIPSWKGAMVRLSDKVTRLATYNATGKLENESLEDNLFDLASYSLLALLLHREDQA